jgi:hypothetical protein
MNESRPSGRLSMVKIPLIKRPKIRTVDDAIRYGTPDGILSVKARWQRRNRENFARSLHDQALFDQNRMPMIGHLWLAKVTAQGDVQDYGLASCRVVTTVGVQYIVDAFQNITEVESMKFHALGTGSGAEAVGNTALTTELTTQYSTSNTRPTGSLGEKSGDATSFETAATITVSATVAATEHGIFNAAATGTGVLLDRTLFSVINLASGDSLLATYDLQFPAGG